MKGVLMSRVRLIAQQEGVTIGQALKVAQERGIVVVDDFPQLAREEQERQDRLVQNAKDSGIVERLSPQELKDAEALDKRRRTKIGTAQGEITRSGIDTVVAKKIEEARATSVFNTKSVQNKNFALGVSSKATKQERQNAINNLRESFANRLLASGDITQEEFNRAKSLGFRGTDNLGRTFEERERDNQVTNEIAKAVNPINTKRLVEKINKNSKTIKIRGSNKLNDKALARLIERGIIKVEDLR